MLQLRPEVAAFAQLMEAKLRENDHKGDWEHEHPDDLMNRVHDEVEELQVAIHLWGCSLGTGTLPAAKVVGKEAADVANFALMIAHVCGGLPLGGTDDAK